MAGLYIYILVLFSFFPPSLTLLCPQSVMIDVQVTSFNIGGMDFRSLCVFFSVWYHCNIYFEVCSAMDCVSNQQNTVFISSRSSYHGTAFTHTFNINKRTFCNVPITVQMKSTLNDLSNISGIITANSKNRSYDVALGTEGSSAHVNVYRRCGSMYQSCEVTCMNGYLQSNYLSYKHSGISFDQCYYNTSILDSYKTGTHVITVQAHPEGNYHIYCLIFTYEIIDGNAIGLFKINNSTGEMTLIKNVEPSYSAKVVNITVKATSIENTAYQTEALLLIKIKKNDLFVAFPNTTRCDNIDSFMFPHDTIIANVSEAALTGTVVRKIATPCQELNSDVSYEILSGNQDGVFELNRTSGVLSIANTTTLDREVRSQYFLRIQAFINGVADVTHVIVNIDDDNDNNPTFSSSSYTFSVYNNAGPNTIIGTVKAVDRDTDSRITYSFVRQSSTFILDGNSGQINLNRTLTSEAKSNYELVVVATDSGANKRQTVVPVTINVLDVNDNKPVFTSSVYNVSIETGEYPRLLLRIHATYKDKNSDIKYYIETGPTNLFSLNQYTGDLSTTKTITTPGIYKLKVAAYGGSPVFNGGITNYNYATVNVIVHPPLQVVG